MKKTSAVSKLTLLAVGFAVSAPGLKTCQAAVSPASQLPRHGVVVSHINAGGEDAVIYRVDDSDPTYYAYCPTCGWTSETVDSPWAAGALAVAHNVANRGHFANLVQSGQ